MNPIAKYISDTDMTQTAFGNLIGVSQGMVYQLLNNIRSPSEKLCVRIERATAGAVTRRDLRPDDWADIWPELVEKSHA